jgi:polysaccharide biosynthesis protein PslL
MDTIPTREPLRIGWIDICKGMGILLVVLGHLQNGTLLEKFIYLFHMPLFFFISGYIHTVQKDLKNLFYKKSVHLLLPYVSFLLLLYPVQIIHIYRHGASNHALQAAIFNLVWGGGRLIGVYGVFWFLPCLFLTQQVMNWLLVQCRPALVAPIVVVALSLSYVNALYFPRFGLPFDANVVCASMPFFYAGHLWRRIDFDSWWMTPVATLGIVYAICNLRQNFSLSYNLRGAVYGVPIVSFGLALCCIVGVIVLSKLIHSVVPSHNLLARFGAASMGIMCIHEGLRSFAGWILQGSRQLGSANSYEAFIVFSGVSYGLTLALMQFSITRALFLGSEKDFAFLRRQWRHPATAIRLYPSGT